MWQWVCCASGNVLTSPQFWIATSDLGYSVALKRITMGQFGSFQWLFDQSPEEEKLSWKIQILSKKSPEFSHCTCTSASIFWLMFYDTQFLRDKLLKKEVPFFGLVTWLSRSGDPHTSPLAMLVNLPLHWTCPYAPDFYNVDADSDIWWCWKNARKEESFFAPPVHGAFLWALHVFILYF